MIVDGTDFCVAQKGTATKGNAFASHKYAGKSALRYELGVSILGGDLVWIQGPYPVGKYTEIKIFNKVLRLFLDLGEQVEDDEGYLGHPNKNKCPQNVGNRAEKWAMQRRVRAHHKMLNGRLKIGGSSPRSTATTWVSTLILKYSTKFYAFSWTRGSEVRTTRGSFDTPTKSSVSRMWGIGQRSGQCRGV
jgi:hypothetical protein